MLNSKIFKVLIVDDSAVNLDILYNALKDKYKVYAALNGKRALEISKKIYPDIILSDIMMPEMSGYELLEEIQNNEKLKDIPVVFISSLDDMHNKVKGLQLGAMDYIIKPFETIEVRARVKNQLLLKEAKNYLQKQNIILEKRVEERVLEIQKLQDAMIYTLADLAETRDVETGLHIKRTQYYVYEIANELKNEGIELELLDDKYIEMLFKTAPLHDIGKVGIPDSILLKKGKLTKEEFEIMKKHPQYGKNALENAKKYTKNSFFIVMAQEIAYSHHEKWDGSGYPNGLKGNNIPLSGRIMSIADVYDALTTERVYKNAISHKDAMRIIISERGKHFDPVITDIFIKIESKIIDIKDKLNEKEQE